MAAKAITPCPVPGIGNRARSPLGWVRPAWIAVMLAGLPAVAHAARPGFRVAPEPAWVRPIAVPESSSVTADQVSGGAYLLLLDTQCNRVATPAEVYVHTAVSVVNERGVSDVSQITFQFDPIYEQLVLHRVVIHRGRSRIDHLDASRVKVLQRETDLAFKIYDGSYTALLVLDDVRPGDVIETSYSLIGQNPVMGGHFDTQWTMGWSQPVRHVHRRLLWPAGRPLMVHSSPDQQPVISKGPRAWDYTWDLESPRPITVDDYTPAWYDPFPRIHATDFRSWNEIARWGAALYGTTGPTELLRQRIDEIRRNHPVPEARALAAIRLVQEEIRYLGIELGERSQRPSDADQVLRQRFGDCKDKTLLLVTLLRALDLEARPAFVSSFRGPMLWGAEPSLMAFDHVIVRLDIPGHAYWIDPTLQAERGSTLSKLDVPDFDCALVLVDSTTGLVPVRRPPGADPLTVIRKTIDARRTDAPASLAVETCYRGRDANQLRYRLRGQSREKLSKGYLDFYARRYPAIERVEPPRITDNESENEITVREVYSIPRFWARDPRDGTMVAQFDAIEAVQPVPNGRAPQRTMPLALDFPAHVICTTRAVMPQGWSAPPDSVRLRDGAMRFRCVSTARRDTLLLYHEFESTRGHVTADASAEVVRDLEAADDAMGYSTSSGHNQRPRPQGAGVNWLGVLVLLASLGLGGGVSGWAYRLRPAAGSPPTAAPLALAPDPLGVAASESAGTSAATGFPTPADPAGESQSTPLKIGGWLYLLGVGVAFTPARILFGWAPLWKYLGLEAWAPVTHPALPAYHGLGPILLLELGGNGILLVGSILILVLFLQRRSSFPRAWIAFIVTSLVFLLVDHVMSLAVSAVTTTVRESSVRTLLQGVAGLAIWGTYLMCSRRVARTFVR